MESTHQQNKHLTYEERQFIEIGLNKRKKLFRDFKRFK